ncbi:hypothetical protein BDR26DRAFT_870638 [Obelidium mucronatum]|nr:hypothetical protein BDR26DRAFT_870638 [Obelidium mucronatum]
MFALLLLCEILEAESAPIPEILPNLSGIYNNITSNAPSLINGPTATNNGSTSIYKVTREVSPASGIAGAALLTAGFSYAFMGKRAYFPSLFLSGFFTFGFISFILLDICQMHWHSFGPYADWIYLCVVGPVAVIGGFLFQKISQVGVVLIGSLNGFMWSNVLLFTGLGATLSPSTHLVFTLALTGMGTATIFFMEHMALVLGTAFVGGFFVAVGGDLFACTGYVEIVNRCFDGTPPHTSEIPGPAWAMLASGIALGMAAWYIQTRSSPPPPPDVVNNPAYWLFGALPPSMPPAVWFKMPTNKPPGRPAPPPPPAFSISNILNPFGWKW